MWKVIKNRPENEILIGTCEPNGFYGLLCRHDGERGFVIFQDQKISLFFASLMVKGLPFGEVNSLRDVLDFLEMFKFETFQELAKWMSEGPVIR